MEGSGASGNEEEAAEDGEGRENAARAMSHMMINILSLAMTFLF